MSINTVRGPLNIFDAVVSALIAVVPGVLREAFPHVEGVCIAASRAGQEALTYFGIDSSPLSVSACAANDLWWAAVEASRPEAALENGGWSVSVLKGHGRPGRWPGHLVLSLRERETILDLTIGSFSRPQHEIVLPEAAEVARTPEKDGWRLRCGGGWIVYGAHPDDRSYRRSPDWRRNGPKVAGTIIRAMKDRLLS